MSGFWLMVYMTAWAHVFGTYPTEAECEAAGRKIAATAESPWYGERTRVNFACVPQPPKK